MKIESPDEMKIESPDGGYIIKFGEGNPDFALLWIGELHKARFETSGIITNTYIAKEPEPETIKIKITKIWGDKGQNGQRPGNITISLNAGEGSDARIFDKIEWDKTSEDNRWFGVIEGLPALETGYTISEKQVEGYEKPVITPSWNEGNTILSVTITNTLIEKTEGDNDDDTGGGDNTGGSGNETGGSQTGGSTDPTPLPTETITPPTTSELVAGDEDIVETTPTEPAPSEVVKGDEDEKEVDVVPTGEGYLFTAVAILFVLAGTAVLVPTLKKRIVKK